MIIMDMTINNYGQVIIASEPKRKTWKRSIKLGNLHFTISNVKVRKACPQRRFNNINPYKLKLELYEENSATCPICGRSFDIKLMELHHVLPWSRFPELRSEKKNIMLLCY